MRYGSLSPSWMKTEQTPGRIIWVALFRVTAMALPGGAGPSIFPYLQADSISAFQTLRHLSSHSEDGQNEAGHEILDVAAVCWSSGLETRQ